jgi:hypothetical protein
MINNTNYASRTLQQLGKDDTAKITQALAMQRHPRFLKSFSNDLPFGTRKAYLEEIANASLEKLEALIKICGFLMQTKVYLVWRRP